MSDTKIKLTSSATERLDEFLRRELPRSVNTTHTVVEPAVPEPGRRVETTI